MKRHRISGRVEFPASHRPGPAGKPGRKRGSKSDATRPQSSHTPLLTQPQTGMFVLEAQIVNPAAPKAWAINGSPGSADSSGRICSPSLREPGTPRDNSRVKPIVKNPDQTNPLPRALNLFEELPSPTSRTYQPSPERKYCSGLISATLEPATTDFSARGGCFSLPL